MSDMPQFEIPAAMRDLAERNVEQARTAYAQLMDMARQAQEMVAKSSGAMAEGTVEIQTRTMRYAQENINASFALAAELARARDLKDYMEIQTRFAQRQIKSYTEQAQDLGRLMSELAQKSQRG